MYVHMCVYRGHVYVHMCICGGHVFCICVYVEAICMCICVYMEVMCIFICVLCMWRPEDNNGCYYLGTVSHSIFCNRVSPLSGNY